MSRTSRQIRRIAAILLIVAGAAVIIATLAQAVPTLDSKNMAEKLPGYAGQIIIGMAMVLGGLGLLPGRVTEPAAENTAPPPARKGSFLMNGSILLGSLIVGLLICEIIVRLLGTTDASGQFFFNDQPIRPYTLPLDEIEQTLTQYEATNDSYILYDAELGWTLRPYAEAVEDPYRANSIGIRSDREYDLTPTPGVLRIALFGDSYTHGSNVPYEDSWGQRLEGMLNDRGIPAEVMNFGVPAYGMDQAYMRWQREGRAYDPDIVIFGFRAPDAYRNVNLFRVIYHPKTESPFSKPRFLLQPDGSLQVVNRPTVPQDEILDTLENFSTSPLAKYEYWYDDVYRHHWWLESRLVAVIVSMQQDEYRNEEKGTPTFYGLDHEGGQLAKAIVDNFAADVEASGSQFMVVTLPEKTDLENVDANLPLIYGPLLQAIDDQHRVAHAENVFDLTGKLDRYFAGHYSPEGNQVIAEAALDQVLAILDSGSVDMTNH